MNTLTSLLSNAAFHEDFALLGSVLLDPSRHTAPTARSHSEAVAARVRELAGLNAFAPEDTSLLEAAGLVHDIGKIDGTTSASASVDRLRRYGALDPRLTELVRYHDVNLPWFLATRRGRGDPPDFSRGSTLASLRCSWWRTGLTAPAAGAPTSRSSGSWMS